MDSTNIGEKNSFSNDLAWMVSKKRDVDGEGYLCIHCAAYPCYRGYKKDNPVGLCFQPVKQCRQECDHFHMNKTQRSGISLKELEGICNLDSTQVFYMQECHISKEKQSNI